MVYRLIHPHKSKLTRRGVLIANVGLSQGGHPPYRGRMVRPFSVRVTTFSVSRRNATGLHLFHKVQVLYTVVFLGVVAMVVTLRDRKAPPTDRFRVVHRVRVSIRVSEKDAIYPNEQYPCVFHPSQKATIPSHRI